MSTELFIQYVQEQLLLYHALESVTGMDNASYHSIALETPPSTSSKILIL
jgi:hypothetical protein